MNRQLKALPSANRTSHRSVAVSHRGGKVRGQHGMSDGPRRGWGDATAREAKGNEDGQIDDRDRDLRMLHGCLQRHYMPGLSELSLRGRRALVRTSAVSAAM